MAEHEEQAAVKSASNPEAAVRTDLEKRLYHLRTLHDFSREIFTVSREKDILRSFLLMTMGTFGVTRGFILLRDGSGEEATTFAPVGIREKDCPALEECSLELLRDIDPENLPPDFSADPRLEELPPGIKDLRPFVIEDDSLGLCGLGSKLTGEPFSADDRELVTTLLNNLALALRNARAFQNTKRLNERLQDKNVELQGALGQLDRRVYHLKTLYEVSRDIFGSVDHGPILKSFLLMTLGNFGVLEGFVLIADTEKGKVTHFHAGGYADSPPDSLRESGLQLLLAEETRAAVEQGSVLQDPRDLPQGAAIALPFALNHGFLGLLALGPKLTGEDYSADDCELLLTLVNNLAIALQNAQSFAEIRQLNQDLQAKNIALEKTLRKVELLEDIKANLSKFVPTAVSSLIEKSTGGEIPAAAEQDVSVLFVDIEGYTRLSERLDRAELNAVVEKYFSVFMDAIHENEGDVNETAGDGLMVLYLNRDRATNALQAVQTALTIRERAGLINREQSGLAEPLAINMGINSGPALVGATKFESYTGGRWTYTARGMVTNVAARIGALAAGGAIHLSESTADRVRGQHAVRPKGKFDLKNVSQKVEIFTLDH